MIMRRLILSVFIYVMCAVAFPSAVAVADSGMAEMFCYTSTHDNGRGGMRLAWREAQGDQWLPLNGKRGIVRSDFGSLKCMYAPRVIFHDDMWIAVWGLDRESESIAVTTSEDMTVWKPQRFMKSVEADSKILTMIGIIRASSEVVEGDTIAGYISCVPKVAIEKYVNNSAVKGKRNRNRGERLIHDDKIYENLGDVRTRIRIDRSNAKPVSDMFVGVFFEDLNYAADGGLYAELLQNRDFEYSKADGNRNPDWNAMFAWEVNGNNVMHSIKEENPLHENNSHYLSLKTSDKGAVLANKGYDGICLKKGDSYDLSMYCRNNSGKRVTFEIMLRHNNGSVLARKTCSGVNPSWKKLQCGLKSKESCDSATLEIHIPPHVSVDLDMVSLFPRKTFKNRPNGLREDLARVIADIHPKFVRFPGGCLVHGDGIDNIYNWKESVGPLESRKHAPNIWRYHQSRGLGYFEYFQFCEDIGAEPLPVVAAGVSCQNSGISGPSHHSHDLITSYGQMGGIPMEEMDGYIQDVLDLIEWANGDKSTKWGKVRADAGHPEPFNLKYIGIGNEDMISDVFETRFKMIYDAVKEKYPEIIVIGTTGPFSEGSDYEAGWEFAENLNLPMVDEHNYNSPGWYINNGDYYDEYPRTRSAVYLGEYAAHEPKRRSTVETALSTALFLTNVERNSDIVRMTSYAPLLARKGYTQWNPDLIYFDGANVYPTVDYEVQKLFGCHSGDRYMPSEVVTTDNYMKDVVRRLGVSAVYNTSTKETFVKVVNLLPVKMYAAIDLGVENIGRVVRKTLSGKPDDTVADYSERRCSTSELDHAEFAPYSITIYTVEGCKDPIQNMANNDSLSD